MQPYTVLVNDTEGEERLLFRLYARDPEDHVKSIVHQQIFERAVNNGDTDFNDIETPKDTEESLSGIVIELVFRGHHRNLITPDEEIEEIDVPEGWVITIPEVTDNP